ncbi:radical SAM protein [Edwardsiella ictaluri]|uniref:radical SAM protein n=2 Tax=Edwardsiella ictaluri TaxID=67780 RepID=UPI002417D872|nr:radical SAM protein [Edwardsiella ictaluri]WFO11805.1 radical SAM protein [Edwardsiella ictaluri]
MENNLLGDGFKLPKGLTDYGVAAQSWNQYAEENGLTPELNQAGHIQGADVTLNARNDNVVFTGGFKMNVNDLLLDFRITSHCDLGCDLCFRNPGISDSSLDDAKLVINKMHDIGFRRIGFTGGEPTSRKDFISLIEYAKGKGFMTYLSTVGHRFIIDHSKLNSILDWVGMPIDGIDKETNTDIRSKKMSNQHRVIKNILIWLPKADNKINIKLKLKLKLTTVVSNSNVNDLNDLNELVSWVKNLPYKTQAWRFYQFCPLGVGKEKREKLEIDESVFKEKMQELKERVMTQI